MHVCAPEVCRHDLCLSACPCLPFPSIFELRWASGAGRGRLLTERPSRLKPPTTGGGRLKPLARDEEECGEEARGMKEASKLTSNAEIINVGKGLLKLLWFKVKKKKRIKQKT
eukprot:GHVT01090095.1.p1 GENE.GHVT01090095.1~~GHVT01090095.1.p1  ORF type:complete len:113 (+),score=20.41 GHVT01090095.1:137-475(+)